MGTLLLLLIIGLVIYLLFSKGKKIPEIFSHWHHLVEGLQISTQEFYKSVEKAIESCQLEDIKVSSLDLHEGGVLSAKREYLRIKRKEHSFDICAAPFGTGFFVSWWLGQSLNPSVNSINKIPFIGPLLIRIFSPETYYRLDTAIMFQESIHAAVVEVLNQTTRAKGLRCLSEQDCKPIMTDLFKR